MRVYNYKITKNLDYVNREMGFFQYDHRFLSLKNAFIKVSFCVKKKEEERI